MTDSTRRHTFLKKQAQTIDAVKKFIGNSLSIKKVIYVKEKLLNFVVS